MMVAKGLGRDMIGLSENQWNGKSQENDPTYFHIYTFYLFAMN